MKLKCPNCLSQFKIKDVNPSQTAAFCPFCGTNLKAAATTLKDTSESGITGVQESVTLVQGHAPDQEKIEFVLGPYQILKSIGKGGMGEVFLAYDTQCGRRIALKKIRDDLLQHKQLFNRFLTESRITSQLTHPSIIPIYSIHQDGDLLYYTMPFVEGETLKEILRVTRRQVKQGEKLHHLGESIPALIRVYVNICQAIAYAHSKHVLHRDIKPENIIIGKYGEVMMLDWGLAKMLEAPPMEPLTIQEEERARMTALGKVVGTVAYMAPERALGMPATIQTDVYALGVILYQLLTLRSPFQRGTLKEFRQNWQKEKVVAPSEAAPYREVPRILEEITLKCLATKSSERYQTVDDLLREIENYLEGRADWFKLAELDIENKDDWEFQENVLIAEHTAITRHLEVSDWVSLMISKDSFSESQKIETEICLGESNIGIGFLLGAPEATEREHLNDGYCIWIGSDKMKGTKFLRSSVEVLVQEDLFIPRGVTIKVSIEKVENQLRLYFNDVLQCFYISYFPLVGTHIGLMTRDVDYQIQPIQIFVGGHSIMVNCLTVPDAFLAHQDYHTALSEYRRIGYAFSGRAEGREAMFRAGITLLEQAKDAVNKDDTDHYYDLALKELEKLHGTPGAPLENLGKALIYQSQKDYDEESKCFELAFRRYPNHPLLKVLQEHITFRTQEIARIDRRATYQFLLIIVRMLPLKARPNHLVPLLNNLQKHWEPLPFIHPLNEVLFEKKQLMDPYAIPLAFWLAKPYVFKELIGDLIHTPNIDWERIQDAFMCLLHLGSYHLVKEMFNHLKKYHETPQLKGLKKALNPMNEEWIRSYTEEPKLLTFEENNLFTLLLTQILDSGRIDLLSSLLPQMKVMNLDEYMIWGYLLLRDWEKAGDVLHKYPLEVLNRESSLLHFLYGCWLSVTEGKDLAQIHFDGVYDMSYPRSWALGSYYLAGKLHDDWFKKAFLWEKRRLYSQLTLYYNVIGDKAQEEKYRTLRDQEVTDLVE